MNNQKSTLPLGILLIAAFYTLGAVILLLLFFINPTQAASAIALRHGVPPSIGNWILPAIAALALLIAFGLASLSRWGYLLTWMYLLYFGGVNGYLNAGQASWTYLGNVIWACLVLLYLILVRNHFFKRNVNQPIPQTGGRS